MSVDARIREGLMMIDRHLPGVDTRTAFEDLTNEVTRRKHRHAAAWLAAAAAVILAVATALTLAQRADEQIQPAPAIPVHSRAIVTGGE